MKFEPYLNVMKNKKYRVMQSKFRLSAHDLEIERGRYGKKRTKSEEKYWEYCRTSNSLAMEDEFYFLMVCRLYDTRKNYYAEKYLWFISKYQNNLLKKPILLANESRKHELLKWDC